MSFVDWTIGSLPSWLILVCAIAQLALTWVSIGVMRDIEDEVDGDD